MVDKSSEAGATDATWSKSDLLVEMTHEMRTPLSAILGFAQLLDSATPPPTPSQKKGIEQILRAGWYLERVLTIAHDLALIESGNLELSLDPVPLAAVMLDCQAIIESKAPKRAVRVTFPRFESPCFVSADRIRLRQVLDNLLSAAIECGHVDGAVVVHCETHGSERIRIGFDDGGDGPSPEQVTRPRAATASAGAGIGLLLAQRLVELMGGAIRMDGIAGQRRTFSFDLKRVLIPTAAGRISTDSAFSDMAIPGGSQGTVHSPTQGK